MGGYAARGYPATGVHDPLFARALAFGEAERPFVCVVCDLVAVDELLVQAVRSAVPEATVWLSATHTHSGPEVGGELAVHGLDASVRERIAAGAIAAARRALESMRPVSATWTSVGVDDVATNRAHPEAPVDLRLDLLRLSAADSFAVLGTFDCHPTVLGPDNLLITADLNGAFCRRLESKLGGSAFVTLATGAAGDISTRHTRHAQDFDEVDRFAGLLVDRAYRALCEAESVRLDGPVVTDDRVSLPNRNHLTICASLSVAKLGEVTLAAVPGELFNRLGCAIRQAGRHVLLLGYTNGYIGYIPTREAYAHELDYEVQVTRLAPGAGEKLVEAIVSL
jgi:hypothetical protein